MIGILTGIVGRIVNNLTLIVVGLCQRAALNEEWQISLLTIAILERAKRLHASLQPLYRLDVEVHTDRVTLVVIVQQIVLLSGVAHRNEIRHSIAATRDVQLIFINGTRAREVVPPVVVAGNNVTVVIGHPGVRHTLRQLKAGVLLGVARLLCLRELPQALVVKRQHLVTVHGVHLIGRGLHAIAARETHLSPTISTLLGGNKQHTIGCLSTINSRCRSILQHIDTLNVGWIDGRQASRINNTIENYQNILTTRDGVCATNGKLGIRTGRTGLTNVQTRYRTLQRLQQVGVGRFLESLDIGSGHGSCHVALSHRTITDDHHLIHLVAILFHCNAHVLSSPEFLSGIAHK